MDDKERAEFRSNFLDLTERLTTIIDAHERVAETIVRFVNTFPASMQAQSLLQLQFHRDTVKVLGLIHMERIAITAMLDTVRKEPTYDLLAEFMAKAQTDKASKAAVEAARQANQANERAKDEKK